MRTNECFLRLCIYSPKLVSEERESQSRKQLQWPRHGNNQIASSTEDWIKEEWYAGTVVYYSAIRRDEILPFTTTWLDLENIMLSETKSVGKS